MQWEIMYRALRRWETRKIRAMGALVYWVTKAIDRSEKKVKYLIAGELKQNEIRMKTLLKKQNLESSI